MIVLPSTNGLRCLEEYTHSCIALYTEGRDSVVKLFCYYFLRVGAGARGWPARNTDYAAELNISILIPGDVRAVVIHVACLIVKT